MWSTRSRLVAEQAEPTERDPCNPGGGHGQKHTATIRQTYNSLLHPGW